MIPLTFLVGEINTTEVNLVLNAIQTGGLISVLTLGIMAFARAWVYPAKIVDDYKAQVVELTKAVQASNEGMERMAAAWEARNALERERAYDAQWDRKERRKGSG